MGGRLLGAGWIESYRAGERRTVIVSNWGRGLLL
jgi:hypothetical protein